MWLGVPHPDLSDLAPVYVFGSAVISKPAQGCGQRRLYPFCHHRAGHTAMGNNNRLASRFRHAMLQGSTGPQRDGRSTQDFSVSGSCRALMSLVSVDIYFYLSPYNSPQAVPPVWV